MASSFLTAKREDAQLWACIDPDTLCTSPVFADRRFASYLAPFPSEPDARQALLEAGADPRTIAAEQRRAKRGKR